MPENEPPEQSEPQPPPETPAAEPSLPTTVRAFMNEMELRNLQGLTQSQRAAIAATMMPAIRAANPPEMPGNGVAVKPELGETRDIAGKAMQVSGGTVGIAARIQKQNPGLFARVLNGEVTIWDAKRQLPKSNRRPPAPDARRIAYAKRQMVEGLSRIRGLCRGLSELDASLTAAGLTREEKDEWVGISRECITALRDFSRKLEDSE